MRLEIIAIVFATVVAAKPWPWAAPAASLGPTANAPPNKTHRGNRTKHHHHEHTPTFKEPCNCPQPIVPMNLLSENEVWELSCGSLNTLTQMTEMLNEACSSHGMLHRIQGWMSIACTGLWTWCS